MNSKLERLRQDIEKLTQRIKDQQQKLNTMQAQKTELENTEILELVRSIDATPETLAVLIKDLKLKANPPLPTQTQMEKPNVYDDQPED